MYAQKLLVHDGSERESTKRLHAGVVDAIGILVLT